MRTPYDSDEEGLLKTKLLLETLIVEPDNKKKAWAPQGSIDTTESRKIKRPSKEKREKMLVGLVTSLWGESLKATEERVGASFDDMKNKGLIRITTDKNGKEEFIAVPFVDSPKGRMEIKTICEDPDVFRNIRHGGPWSEQKGLLENTYARYMEGLRTFLEKDWQYNPEQPNLTLAFSIYHKSTGDLVGRGGLQVEDEAPGRPPMTEPFVAITKSNTFWDRGIASMFFREHLIPFFDDHTSKAPMRFLSLPSNKASRQIALNPLTPGAKFEEKDPFRHPQWKGVTYDVFERNFEGPTEPAQMD